MSRVRCEVDAARLMHYLGDPASDPALPDHISQCRYCQVRLLAIASASQQGGGDRRECVEYQAQLPELLAAEETGEWDAECFADLQMHLVLCEECFAAYSELRFLDQLALAPDLPVPVGVYRAPDLSFLRPPFTWIQAEVRELGTKILRTLRLNLALLFQPAPALAPAPVRSRGRARPGQAGASQEFRLAGDELGSVDIAARLTSHVTNSALASLQVYVRLVTRQDLDFTGTRLRLILPDGQELLRETDSRGRAEFADLPLAAISAAVLEVTPQAEAG